MNSKEASNKMNSYEIIMTPDATVDLTELRTSKTPCLSGREFFTQSKSPKALFP